MSRAQADFGGRAYVRRRGCGLFLAERAEELADVRRAVGKRRAKLRRAFHGRGPGLRCRIARCCDSGRDGVACCCSSACRKRPDLRRPVGKRMGCVRDDVALLDVGRSRLDSRAGKLAQMLPQRFGTGLERCVGNAARHQAADNGDDLADAFRERFLGELHARHSQHLFRMG